MTSAEARFNNSLRPRKPEGSLGRTAQDGHLDSHTAPELWRKFCVCARFYAWGMCAFVIEMATDTLKLFGPNSERDSEIFEHSTSVLSVYGLNYKNSFYI